MNEEQQRLAFVESRDGVEGAVVFAKQTLSCYRKAVLTSRKRGAKKPHHASLPEFRPSFIKSYCVLKQYIKEKDHAR